MKILRVLLLALVAQPALAQAPQPLQAPQVSLWAGRGVVLSQAGASWVWWARATGRWPLSQRFALVGRVEASGLPLRFAGGDRATYQSGETHGGALLRLRPRLDVAGVYGTTWRLDGAPQPERPSTWGLGARLEIPGGGYVYVLGGQHGAAGPGLRLIVVAQVPVRAGLVAAVDFVSGHPGWQRVGLAWSVPIP